MPAWIDPGNCLEIAMGRLDSKILSLDFSCPQMPAEIRNAPPSQTLLIVWRWLCPALSLSRGWATASLLRMSAVLLYQKNSAMFVAEKAQKERNVRRFWRLTDVPLCVILNATLTSQRQS